MNGWRPLWLSNSEAADLRTPDLGWSPHQPLSQMAHPSRWRKCRMVPHQEAALTAVVGKGPNLLRTHHKQGLPFQVAHVVAEPGRSVPGNQKQPKADTPLSLKVDRAGCALVSVVSREYCSRSWTSETPPAGSGEERHWYSQVGKGWQYQHVISSLPLGVRPSLTHATIDSTLRD